MKTKVNSSEESIFEAALYEFAEKGYAKTSTSAICERAGVAKGLLFHYYKSKKNLYLSILDESLETLLKYISETDIPKDQDIIEQIFCLSESKIRFFKDHFLMGKILVYNIYYEKDETPTEVTEKIEHYRIKGMNEIYRVLNKQGFRPGIDEDKALEFIIMTLANYSLHLLDENSEYEKMVENFDSIVQQLRDVSDFIRYGVYSQ